MLDSLPVMYPYMLCDKMRESAYQLKGNDRLTWAKDWKRIEIQELFISCSQEGKGYWETEQYESALTSFGECRRVIEMFMRTDEITYDSYLWNGMQTHHWCSLLEEAGCLVKLGHAEEAKAKIERSKHILMHAWKNPDGSVDAYKQSSEEIFSSFRKYYSEWGLDALGACPV